MYQGYVKLHRRMLETSFYKDLPVCRLATHLVLRANFRERKSIGEPVQRGQVITGRMKLSDETGLTQQQVRRALQVLQNEGFISISTTNKFSTITLCNYGLYQCDDSSEQPTKNQPTTNKEPLHKNVKKNKNIYIERFEEIWKMYPKRIGKKDALRHFGATVKKEEDVDNIKLALKNYLKSKSVKDGYIQNGSTWFNNWQDHIPEKRPTKRKRVILDEDSPSPFEDMLKEKEDAIPAKKEDRKDWAVDLM